MSALCQEKIDYQHASYLFVHLSHTAYLKDTVTADVQHHKIETNYNANRVNTTECFDAIVHDRIPIFARQNLQPHAFNDLFHCAIYNPHLVFNINSSSAFKNNNTNKNYLEDCDKRLSKCVEMTSRLVEINVKVKPTAKHLHAEQGEDNNEEKEQQQQTGNGTNTVQK
jgi:hypothetical protein